MSDIRVRRECFGKVAVLTMDSPPVNAFALALRQQLYDALRWARRDPEVGAVVLAGAGRGFSAGGDIREFGTPAAAAKPGLSSHIHVVIENLGKPVVAMVHGLALGGGLETAMACHYRVVEEDALVGLPEVGLGTLPLSGTQRLPRLLGLVAAVKFMVEGGRQVASNFSGTPLWDELVEPGNGLDAACELAASLVGKVSGDELVQRLVRNRSLPDRDAQRALLEARQWLSSRQPNTAELTLMQAVEAVLLDDFDAGMNVARRLFDQLMTGDDIRQSRNRFLAASPTSQSAE